MPLQQLREQLPDKMLKMRLFSPQLWTVYMRVVLVAGVYAVTLYL